MATSEKRTLSIEARLRDNLTRQLGPMERALTRFAVGGATGIKSLAAGFFSAKAAIAGLIGGFGALKALGVVRSFGDQADALRKLAQSTGDTVENLSELQQAMVFTNVKAENFDAILKSLVNAQRNAAEGGARARDTFRQFGISIEEVRALGPAQLFERIAGGLEQLGSEFEREAALARLLPDQFLTLMPLLGRGLAEFQRTVLEARTAGATITEQQAAAADAVNTALAKVQVSIGSVSRALIEAFGPQAARVLEAVAAGIARNRDLVVDFAKAIGQGVVRAVSLAADAIIALVGVIEMIPGINLVPPEFAAQRRQLEDTIRSLQVMTARGFFPKDVTDQQIADLERQLAALNAKANQGIAEQMRETKRQMAASFSDLLAGVQTTAAAVAPKTSDETAQRLGLPTSDDWAAYAQQMNQAMSQLAGDLRQQAASVPPSVSVFRTPTRAAAPAESGTRDMTRERLALLQQLGGLAPELRVIQDQLREIEAQSVVLQLQDAHEKGVINAQELAAAVGLVRSQLQRAKAAAADFFGGFTEGVRNAVRKWTDFAAAGRDAAMQLVDGGLDHMVDGIADVITGTKSAKQALKDFARSVLSDLARVVAKMLVMNTLQAALGGTSLGSSLGLVRNETGGVVRGQMLSMRAFAKGGIARGPTLALFGEGSASKGEAFVPLPDGRNIPVAFVGEGQRAGNTVNVHITAWDSKDVARTFAENQRLLGALWQNQVETRQGMRQVVRRAAS